MLNRDVTISPTTTDDHESLLVGMRVVVAMRLAVPAGAAGNASTVDRSRRW